jgi:hypothetical protein
MKERKYGSRKMEVHAGLQEAAVAMAEREDKTVGQIR